MPALSDDLKAQISEKFSAGTQLPGGMTITSLSVISADDLSGGYKEGDPWEILSGSGHYEELLCGLKFTVSPFAFF